MPANHNDLEKRLWDAADELRANSKLKSSEYSIPVLGLIFLRYAGHKFAQAEKTLASFSAPRPPDAAASARPTTRPRASSTSPRAPVSPTSSTSPKAPTSARPSTTP